MNMIVLNMLDGTESSLRLTTAMLENIDSCDLNRARGVAECAFGDRFTQNVWTGLLLTLRGRVELHVTTGTLTFKAAHKRG